MTATTTRAVVATAAATTAAPQLPSTGGGGMAVLPGEVALLVLGAAGLGAAARKAARR